MSTQAKTRIKYNGPTLEEPTRMSDLIMLVAFVIGAVLIATSVAVESSERLRSFFNHFTW